MKIERCSYVELDYWPFVGINRWALIVKWFVDQWRGAADFFFYYWLRNSTINQHSPNNFVLFEDVILDTSIQFFQS